VADDDVEDQEMITMAFKAAGVYEDLRFVNDGVELLDYLHHAGSFEGEVDAPRPDLILLDLNMPRLDGHGALRQIKSDESLSDIPVIVFTTSTSEKDVEETYRQGAQSYVIKPFSFTDLVTKVQNICTYWSEVSVLPEATS
tara:strand:- start:290 stop:712 length:423 start_codon:yes stop_codon:yes gene_type:complete